MSQPDQNNPDHPTQQAFSHSPVAARVPERIGRGVYTTGQVVLDSPKEFMIDFLQGLTRPHQVVARVVLTPQTMQEFAGAFAENLENYRKHFGVPPAPPVPPNAPRPTIQEIYENFRVPEELMSGTYANSVLIGHGASEFFMDFITGFYPTSAVSARVVLPAAQAPRFHNTLVAAMSQYRQRYMGGAGGAPPVVPPPQTPPGSPGGAGDPTGGTGDPRPPSAT